MRPKKPVATGAGDLFRARLDQVMRIGKASPSAAAAEIVLEYVRSGRRG